MYFFEDFLKLFFYCFDQFYDRKYISEANKFIRKRKMSFEDYITYILVQQGCTNYIEAIRFFYKIQKQCFSNDFQPGNRKNKDNLSFQSYLIIWMKFLSTVCMINSRIILKTRVLLFVHAMEVLWTCQM